MSQGEPGFRNISNNHFGDNVTIHQGDVHNHASDQATQCLKDLRSTDPRDDKMRIQNTKGGLLRDSYRWILEHDTFKDWRDNAENRILWIKGDPGKGKTMLLCGIIDELMPMTKLAQQNGQTTNTVLMSYFFCQGTDGRINNATAVLRGLIYLIIVQEPSLISHIQDKYKHAGKDLFSDVNAWVALSDIFATILQDSKVKEVILVIDALDECEADLSKLLDILIQQFALPHIKCIVSSRNILGIQQRIESYIPQGILSLELTGNASCVSEAVDAYIKHTISRLASIQDDHGAQEELRKLIQQQANGTFLWVSLAMKELQDVQVWELLETVADMPTDLAALYNRMMNQINSLKRRNKTLCRHILSAILTAYYPLSLAEVRVLAGIPDQISENAKSMTKLVTMCGSFLTVNEDKVYFIHQSAKDFLATEIHSTDAAQRHSIMFERSVAAISKLSKNIYGLADFGPRPEDAQPPDPNPLASMRYSCFYWANHLCDTCGASTEDEAQAIINEALEPFLNSYLLRWIESLSLLGGTLEGLRSIRKLLRELPHNENTQLSSVLSTVETFILRNGALIATSPLQVYGSALIFSPLQDRIRTTYWDQRTSFIQNIQGIRTDAFLKTLGNQTSFIQAVTFSSNGEMIVSMARDGQLHCWDVATGALKWTFQCHYSDVRTSAMAFSPGDTMLLLATCGVPTQERNTKQFGVEEAKSDGSQITYIALSPTSGIPDTSRGNHTVRLHWPPPIIERYHDVNDFAFSSDCKTLASSLDSNSIQIWDAATGICRQTIQGHDGEFQAIAVSSDGSKIASGGGGKLRLWDAATSAQLQGFDATEAPHLTGFDFEMGCRYGKGIIRAITFCQDGSEKLLIAFSEIGNNLWDPATGTLVQTCMGKDDSVEAISPDNKILASAGCQVVLWDATIGMQAENESNLGTNADWIFAFTLDGKTAACAKSNMVQIWDTATGECWRTIEDYWPDDNDIPGQRDAAPQIVEQDRAIYTAIAISANGKALALAAWHLSRFAPTESSCEIQVWDTMTGDCISREIIPRNRVSTCAFSPDGNKLAVGFTTGMIMLLDVATDRWLWKVERPSAFGPRCFAFFPDNSVLASAHCHRSEAKNCEIDFWDTARGSFRQRFVVKMAKDMSYKHIMFSPDCRTLYIERRYKARLFEQDEEIPGLDKDLPKAMRDKGVPVTDGWVTKKGKRLLWVPEEYRTRCAFVYGNTVVLGHRGGITFIWLDL